jgi:hypothetical protein
MASARQAGEASVLAKILRFCRFCGDETPHEVRNGLSGPRLLCVRCRERALLEELDRD